MPLPLKQATLGRGKVYSCPACRRRLRTSRPSKLAAAIIFAVAWTAERYVGFLPVAAVLLVAFVIELVTVRVTLSTGC